MASNLRAHPVTLADGELVVGAEASFFDAAAAAMGIDKLHQIDTGLDPVTAEREQWDDGTNFLAVEPGVVVGYNRNVTTNTMLRRNGIEVTEVRKHYEAAEGEEVVRPGAAAVDGAGDATRQADAVDVDEAVAWLGQRQAHGAREEAVLEVGRVVHARREEHHGWVALGSRRHRAQ